MILAAQQAAGTERAQNTLCGLSQAPSLKKQAKSNRPTLEVAVALAVGRAPEPCGAILTPCQQALPVGAEAQPVDASLVIGTDLDGGAAVPHPGEGSRGSGVSSWALGTPLEPPWISSRLPPAHFSHYLNSEKLSWMVLTPVRGHRAGR